MATDLATALDRLCALTPSQQWVLDQTAALARIRVGDTRGYCIFCGATLRNPDDLFCPGSDC